MDERAPNQFPVTAVAPHTLDLGADGLLPLCLSEDWADSFPHIQGAVLMLHGRLRDAPVYLDTAATAIAGRPGWLAVVPQFLAGIDVDAHALPPRTLRWSLTGWMGGDAAVAPSPLSAFAAIDAVLAWLSDPARFPALRHLVLAGHSGGGQVLQRYALLGGERPGLRYIVANPSSYAYLDAGRPCPDVDCPGYDQWKYGLTDLPGYAAGQTPQALAERYAARDVSYLLGADDTDPAHPALDTSCQARCQGPHRRARGEAFYAALKARFPSSPHRLQIVPGVGHSGSGIFTSAEGLNALFG
jgi:hypothetical protein